MAEKDAEIWTLSFQSSNFRTFSDLKYDKVQISASFSAIKNDKVQLSELFPPIKMTKSNFPHFF
jgi:hypothetical protein